MNKNKIKVIACGGAGISIADNVFRNIEELGTGFAGVEYLYIDTATNNIEKIDHVKDSFWHVKTTSYNENELHGSGGERKHNAKHASANVLDFLEKHNIKKAVKGEYYVVLASGSGGSGNILATLVIKALLEKGLPTIAVIVGDSSNGLYAINTLNTLAGLNNVAKKTNTALSTIYVNNASFEGNVEDKVKEANKKLFNTLGTLSMFLSGVNGDIDDQDLINIINQRLYKTIDIKPGLYGLVTYSGTINLPERAVPTVGRTLTTENVSPDIDVNLLHHKSGYVTDENALSIYEGQFPVHLVSYANFFSIEQEYLKTTKEHYENIMNNIVNEDIEVEDTDTDDDGLVF